MRYAAVLLVTVLGLSGCTDVPRDPSGDLPGTGPSAASTPPAPVTAPEPPDRPVEGACHTLTLDQALAATSDEPAGDCREPHTTRTYLVGDVDALVDGHLLAVDSERVQAQVAGDCPEALPAFLGGGVDAQRLSVLRPVWFTPSLADSDAGAAWFRCDVVAVDGSAGPAGLATLRGRLGGVLATAAGRDRWGLCGTGAPDDEAAIRVPCSADHTWRAVTVVDLGGGRYPGERAASRAGQERCEAIGRERAEDPLSFAWGYEWPTEDQWDAGQTFGRCWVPDVEG